MAIIARPCEKCGLVLLGLIFYNPPMKASTSVLSPATRQRLKSEAHRLNPVVLIGNEGLTPAVLKEIEASLKAHELLKIKASGAEREDREAWLTQICEELGAQPVQHIGKILIIYRERPPVKEAATKPGRKTKTGTKAVKKAVATVRTPARPVSRGNTAAKKRPAAR